MIRSILLFCIGSVSVLSGCRKETPKHIVNRFNFDDANVVYVYSADPLGAPERCKNLKDIRKAEFDLELFKELIPHVTYKNPKINKTIWKGSCLAIVKFSDGTELHLAISLYGSFFKILGEVGIYTFAGNPEAANKWRKEFYDRILVEKFIPKSKGGKAPD